MSKTLASESKRYKWGAKKLSLMVSIIIKKTVLVLVLVFTFFLSHLRYLSLYFMHSLPISLLFSILLYLFFSTFSKSCGINLIYFSIFSPPLFWYWLFFYLFLHSLPLQALYKQWLPLVIILVIALVVLLSRFLSFGSSKKWKKKMKKKIEICEKKQKNKKN